jgi:DNA polymerase III delta prime subunit
MDFAVASRVINAILLVQEGSDNFPLTEETRENLDELKAQILARANNPRLMERLFILFSNHTTQLQWITPDVAAMLDQDKYRQVNEELGEGLGFSQVLITGSAKAGSGGSAEVSTWAIQPMMEQVRTELIDWVSVQYEKLGEMNGFRNIPVPNFKPLKLQDAVKTAAVFAQAFKEGNLSRTTRNDMLGLDFNAEVELMKDELVVMKGMPAFPPMPYSPLPPGMGDNGRPQGSQNVPVNNRNTGVKPTGQQPLSRVKAELMEDEEVLNLINRIAESTGIEITEEKLEQIGGILEY